MTDNSDMPKVIWALDDQLEYPRLWEYEPDEDGTKYTRADLHKDRLKRIEAAIGPLINLAECYQAELQEHRMKLEIIKDGIQALQDVREMMG